MSLPKHKYLSFVHGKPVSPEVPETIGKYVLIVGPKGGVLAQKINYMNNVTEIYSKGFNITIPENTHFPDQKPGTFRAGAQGWYVFLKPLPPGDHTILYTVNVDPNSVNNISAEITYLMHIK
jgi:hypothetical protein